MIQNSTTSQKNGNATYALVGIHGVFFSETCEVEVDEADSLEHIAQMLKNTYHENAFGFRRFYKINDDRKWIDKGWIYTGGKKVTREEVFLQNDLDSSNSILASKMKINGIDAVVMFSCGKVYPLEEDDIVL